jgi:hypothetical protein
MSKARLPQSLNIKIGQGAKGLVAIPSFFQPCYDSRATTPRHTDQFMNMSRSDYLSSRMESSRGKISRHHRKMFVVLYVHIL